MHPPPRRNEKHRRRDRRRPDNRLAGSGWLDRVEILPKETNTRFVVTTRADSPTQVYDWYVDRGESENWIKDLKHGCFADRLSCHRFWAN